MEKSAIESLPEIIIASRRAVISDYSALGMFCYTVTGPEMAIVQNIPSLIRMMNATYAILIIFITKYSLILRKFKDWAL